MNIPMYEGVRVADGTIVRGYGLRSLDGSGVWIAMPEGGDLFTFVQVEASSLRCIDG